MMRAPTKEDARFFLKALRDAQAERERAWRDGNQEAWLALPRTREVILEMSASHGIPEKRCLFLLGKWSGKGWYDYGVCLDLGWLTPAGMAVEAN